MQHPTTRHDQRAIHFISITSERLGQVRSCRQGSRSSEKGLKDSLPFAYIRSWLLTAKATPWPDRSEAWVIVLLVNSSSKRSARFCRPHGAVFERFVIILLLPVFESLELFANLGHIDLPKKAVSSAESPSAWRLSESAQYLGPLANSQVNFLIWVSWCNCLQRLAEASQGNIKVPFKLCMTW